MTSLPVNGLLFHSVNVEIASNNKSLRKRVKSSLSKDGDGANQSPGMVPKIAVVSYDEEDLNDVRHGEPHNSLNEWTENEDGELTESNNRSKRINGDITIATHGILNGEAFQSSDQLVPLLDEQRDDEFQTEIAGTGDTKLEEGSFTIGLQVFFPFLIAGFGTVSAGILLDVVQVKIFSFLKERYDISLLDIMPCYLHFSVSWQEFYLVIISLII